MNEASTVRIDFFGYTITDRTTPQEINEVALVLADRLYFSTEAIKQSILKELQAKRIYSEI